MSNANHWDEIAATYSAAFTKAWQKRKKEHVDLKAAKPTFFWSHGGSTEWIADPLNRPIVSENRIVFDYPTQQWPRPRHTHLVDMRLASDGHYRWQTSKNSYQGVRTESETHVIVTGKWLSLGEHGNFVTVLPKRVAE